MSNVIGLDSRDEFCMSNGLTDVFLNVLVLSGSALAGTEGEKRLIIWLAEHDQSRTGGGTAGFDLGELPWDPETFASDRAFLLRTAAAARERLGWDRLDFCPNEGLLFPCLDKFSALLAEMDGAEIRPEHMTQWLAEAGPSDPVRRGFPMCPRHGALLTVFGCQICNN